MAKLRDFICVQQTLGFARDYVSIADLGPETQKTQLVRLPNRNGDATSVYKNEYFVMPQTAVGAAATITYLTPSFRFSMRSYVAISHLLASKHMLTYFEPYGAIREHLLETILRSLSPQAFAAVDDPISPSSAKKLALYQTPENRFNTELFEYASNFFFNTIFSDSFTLVDQESIRFTGVETNHIETHRLSCQVYLGRLKPINRTI